MEEASKAEIREVVETNDRDVEMESLCYFPVFFTNLGKGEDPMEGGRGVLPSQNCGGIY